MGLELDADGRPVLTGSSCLPKWYPPGQEPTEPTPATSGGKAQGGKRDPKRKTADRFAVLNAFVDTTMHGLTKAEIATWLCLYRDTKRGTVRTSQADIARRSGLSVRSVKSAVKSLTAAGLLRVVFRGSLNQGPSRYQVIPIRKHTP